MVEIANKGDSITRGISARKNDTRYGDCSILGKLQDGRGVSCVIRIGKAESVTEGVCD